MASGAQKLLGWVLAMLLAGTPYLAMAADDAGLWYWKRTEDACSATTADTDGGNVVFASNGAAYLIAFGPVGSGEDGLGAVDVDGQSFTPTFKRFASGYVSAILDEGMVAALKAGHTMTIGWAGDPERIVSLSGAGRAFDIIEGCGQEIAARKERLEAEQAAYAAQAVAEEKKQRAQQRRQAFFRGLAIAGMALGAAGAAYDDEPSTPTFGTSALGGRRPSPGDPEWRAWRDCVPNSIGPGGCDSIGPGGGKSIGPGGGLSIGPRGGLSIGPGGGQSIGPGGGQSNGPGGGKAIDRDWRCGLDTETMRPNANRGVQVGPCPNR